MRGYNRIVVYCDYNDSSTCCDGYSIKRDFDLTEETLYYYGKLTCETFDEHDYYLKEIRFYKEEKYIEVYFYSDWWDKL